MVALAGCIQAAAASETITGRVVGVADGDTLTVLDGSKQQHKIRVEGVDAPEARQPFGDRSRQSLRDLALGRDAIAFCTKLDRYERQVCRVTVDGVDVGLAQIRRGMAWHFKRYENEQRPEDRRAYADAEVEARSERRGLWRDPAPVAPWDWRAAQRGGGN